MTDASKDAPTSPGEHPPRVLSLGATAAAVSKNLQAAGFLVQEYPDVTRLPADPGFESFDAIILDLTPGGLSATDAATLAERLARLQQGAARPLVLGLTEGGAPASGSAAPMGADAWIAAGRTDRARLEIEGAVAIRRLAAARREIERLRRAVLHARRTAHDLAQPLTTVLARSQLLLRKLAPDDPNHRALSILCTEADRLAKMMEAFQTLRELAPLPESTAPQSPPQPDHRSKGR